MTKTVFFLSAGIAMAVGTIAALLQFRPPAEKIDLPELVHIPPGAYSYRMAGEFRFNNKVVNAPLVQRVATKALTLMKYPVSRGEYDRCVAAGACVASSPGAGPALPQTQVSFVDARAYAAWLSARTGRHWRLPTDEEWVRAAGDRYIDDAPPGPDDGSDPAQRWLWEYRRSAAEQRGPDPTLRPRGAFGENNFGVADMAGNVWEWTETCFFNITLTGDRRTVRDRTDYCGVRVVEGRHRAYVTDFVRDAKAGGCAAGVPPDHLGFRLVLDDPAARRP